mmetsp:Transcript_17539/g.22770  ORF Transcript_17539/g.22770 Transcript_17539/m.22770 type:complete len:133 (-) Transcript_17539:67-465(-)
MVACNGRVVVKAHHDSEKEGGNNNNNGNNLIPKIGSIIVGVNGYVIPYMAAFVKVLQLMKHMMRTPPVTVMFAEDDDFTSMFLEDFLPNLPLRRIPTSLTTVGNYPSSSSSSIRYNPRPRQQQKEEVIELSD